MKSPKLLPWLARRAGLSTARVEVLWREACTYARNATGENQTPRFWKAANARWLGLIEAEQLATSPQASLPTGLLVSLLSASLLVTTGVLAQMSANSRQLLQHLKHRFV